MTQGGHSHANLKKIISEIMTEVFKIVAIIWLFFSAKWCLDTKSAEKAWN